MSKNYTLEAEKDSDAEEVIALLNLLGGETDYMPFGKDGYNMTAEEHIGLMKSRITVVAKSKADGKIVAHGFVMAYPWHRCHVFYFGVGVLKEHWRQGIGSAILEYSCTKAMDAGAEKMTLDVNPENKGALKCYENYGFEVEGHLKKEFKTANGKYHDALIMSKWLDK